MQNTPGTSKINQSGMSTASPVVVAPSPSSAHNTPSSKPFDDSCFKTPLPPTNRKGRPPRNKVNMGNRQANGHHDSTPTPKPRSGRGSRGGRTPAVSKGPTRGRRPSNPPNSRRIIPQKPEPPPKKFSLHDIVCPKTNVYLKKFKMPKFASLAPERRMKMERFKQEVKVEPVEQEPCCSSTVKTEAIDKSDQKPDLDKIKMEGGKVMKVEIGAEAVKRRPIIPRRAFLPGEKMLPFVEEHIIDEYSLLTFTCREDERIFALELRKRKAVRDAKRRKFQLERIRKINRIKRRIRRKKRIIEKTNRSVRKRQRALKRERLRRARKEKHAQLKKVVRDAKANGQLTSELKKAWKAEKERCKQRREELRKRKALHEERKDEWRVKREKEYRKKGKKRRSKKAKKLREKKLKEKQAKTARGRKMKDPGPALVESAGATTLKRPASKTPSPIPNKTPRIEDVYRNGIIGIAKSDSTTSTPLPIVATPPGLAPPRTPQSVESKPHTTSSESAHPSDPGHRAPSAASLGPPGLFVNTSSAQNSLLAGSMPQIQLDQMRLAAAAAAGNPFLPGGVNLNVIQLIQQHQLQQQAGNNHAAAALLQATGGGAGLPFPPNALGQQLAASAALLGRALPTPALKKPGKWCGMHVKIAQDVQNMRKAQETRQMQEQKVQQQQPQQPQQQQQEAALLAQQQALAAAVSQQQQRQAPQPPHCLPSTSGAQPQGLAGLTPLQQQQLAQSGLNPQMISAIQQEAARQRAAGATPKPPQAGLQQGMTPQRPPSTLQRQPGLPPGLGQMGMQGLASLAGGLPLAPPSSIAGSLTSGQSDQAILHLMQQMQQIQQQQAAQQQQMQPQQHALLQQQQREQQAALQQQAQHHGIPVSVATSQHQLLAQQQMIQQAQAQQAQALRFADPSQLLQLQMLQQLDPGRAAAIIQAAQQQQQQAAQQQQQQAQAAPPNSAATPVSSAQSQQGQMEFLRAHMEHQQQNLLLAAQQAQQAAQQQQQATTQASAQQQQQQQAADPREALLMRQMLLGQQGGARGYEALLAARGLPPGLQGLPAGLQQQVAQQQAAAQQAAGGGAPAASQAQLFQPGMMGIQLPTMYKQMQQMPYANQLQQLSQLKQREDPAAAVPNGR